MDGEGEHEDVLMELKGGDSVSTVISSALKSSEKEQSLTPEDLAWVDSCLVPDSDVPEGGSWDTLRDALLDVLASHPDASPPPTHLSSVILEDGESDRHVVKEMEENMENEDGVRNVVNEFRFENAFLPTYKEGVVESGDVGVDEVSELGYGFRFDENVTEPSVTEIFKVWELESLTEEDDFATQLSKALKSVDSIPPDSTETSYEASQLTAEAMARWKVTKDESVDELIAGIADLSLSQSNV